MSAFQTFGDAISSLNIDKTSLPNSALELVSNVLGNAKTEPEQKKDNNDKEPTATKTINSSSLTVWKIIKISVLLSTSFVLFSTSFVKDNITKVTNKPFLTLVVLFFLFLMISFLSIKWLS